LSNRLPVGEDQGMSKALFLIVAVGISLLAIGVGLTILFVWMAWRKGGSPRK
jgi:hypothetical protein